MVVSKKFIQARKIQLLQEKKNLENELKQVAEKNKHEKGGYLPRYFDIGDKQDENAQEVAIFSDTISIEKNVETFLEEVDKALEKLEKNTYGFCERCKKQISPERLEAFPAVTLCMKCKKLAS